MAPKGNYVVKVHYFIYSHLAMYTFSCYWPEKSSTRDKNPVLSVSCRNARHFERAVH
jgi:hypothetical protein